IGALIVGHKQDSQWHEAGEIPLSQYAADAAGIDRAVDLARNWLRLRQTPRTDRRIGIVLAHYPIRHGRLANGVGYDAPQSTVEILKALQDAGYGLERLPVSGNQLISWLQQGPTNAAPERGVSPAVLPLARYRELFAALPDKIREEV